MKVIKSIRQNIQAVFEHDPAAKNIWQIIFVHPGFHAQRFHCPTHTLWNWHIPFSACLISHISCFLAGIKICPGARTGNGFFSGHDMGVVEIRSPHTDAVEKFPDPVWEKRISRAGESCEGYAARNQGG